MKEQVKRLALTIALFAAFSQINAQMINIWDNYPGPPTKDPNNHEFWSVQSSPCKTGASPWVLGGNMMAGPAADPSIGTCDNFPFILKSFNNQSIFLMPNSYVGMGLNNAMPSAALDIANTDLNTPSNVSHFRIFADQDGNIESTTGINMNFAQNSILNFNEGSKASNTSWMSILSGGRVIVGDNSNYYYFSATSNYKLDVYAFNSHNAINVGATGSTIAYNVLDPGIGKSSFSVLGSGKTIIGSQTQTTTGSYANAMLTVNGTAVAREIVVTNSDWADYVFADNYKLPTLSETEKFYKANKHLPEVPSEREVKENGVNLGDMNTLLLKKIEELTLYLVAQEKKQQELEKEIEKLKASSHK